MNFDIKERCKGKTLLGVGPVTKNTIDATINLAKLFDIPIQLIPSRRQVDAKCFGGGYVMDTETFAAYVREKDKSGNIILARDHGGPYQGSKIDDRLEVDDAVESFECDIINGFDVLHIDPSLNPNLKDFTDLREQVEQLLHNCTDFAIKNGKNVFYEVGTDGHGTKPSDINQMKELVDYLSHWKEIKFLVANTGTCVKEKCNIGALHFKETLEFIMLCNENGLMLKEHNNDYNSFSTLQLHRALGIHSSNIAPEYGVAETTELIRLLKLSGLYREYEDFIKLAYESKKWEKWMINGEHPDKEYLATICGHYIMERPEVKEIKIKLSEHYTGMGDADHFLRGAVEMKIFEHLTAFGWTK
jgi:hypothetical protein